MIHTAVYSSVSMMASEHRWVGEGVGWGRGVMLHREMGDAISESFTYLRPVYRYAWLASSVAQNPPLPFLSDARLR